MFSTILLTELRRVFRSPAFPVLSAIYALLVLLAFLNGYRDLTASGDQRKEAETLFRKEWEALRTNPHSAAHVGTYLFKPVAFLQLVDPGLNDYTGISYRVEAHKQHEPGYAIAQDSDSYIRFGELSLAFILQLLVPLFILLLSHNAISREKEEGTLKLLLIQCNRPFLLMMAKTGAYYIIALLYVLGAALPVLVFLSLRSAPATEWGRLWLLAAGYLLFLLWVTLACVLLSAWSKRSLPALLAGLLCWMAWGIIVPRVAAGMAADRYPFPSRYQFNKWVEDGYFKGIDGDKDARGRRADLQQALLRKYNVDTVSRLPVSFEGLAMQAAEDYNSKVYLRYAAGLERQMLQQQALARQVSLFDPFMAVQLFSMTLAGSDLEHYLRFLHQAQRYRDAFMRRLNMDMALHGNNSDPYKYAPGPAFYRQMPAFRYRPPHGAWLWERLKVPLLTLTVWALLTLFLVLITSKKLIRP